MADLTQATIFFEFLTPTHHSIKLTYLMSFTTHLL